MSKTVPKKVELEEDKSGKLGFENAPKLFSKWSYDDIKVTNSSCRSKTLASSITSQLNPLNLKCSYPTLLADIKPKNSEKPFVRLLNVSLAPCSSTAETQARKLKPSASSDTLSKLFTFLQEKILLKYLLVPFSRLDPEKTLLVLELEVWSESKLLMCLPSEESTRPFT